MNGTESAMPDPQVWDERLETGVSAIDLQHRVLFDLLMQFGHADESVLTPHPQQVLEQLKAYARYHFRYEEAWVQQQAAERPTVTLHAQQHAHFVEALARFEVQWREGSLRLPELQAFLKRWLIGHIILQDLPMVRTLQSGGRPAPGEPVPTP